MPTIWPRRIGTAPSATDLWGAQLFGLRSRRRRRLRELPVDETRRRLLEDRVPYYRLLPPAGRRELEGLVQVILDEKYFEGCAGFTVDEAVRTTIAGNASVLLLGRETDYYPLLSSILVYPSSFVAPIQMHHHDGCVSEDEEVRAGESWSAGSIVLSWEDVERDLCGDEAGYNVVIHEFAHQLDDECSDGEGLPKLPCREMVAEWSRVFASEYEELSRLVEGRREPLLGAYAAESPAEFFAVSTETFFTLPLDMQREHAALYRLLAELYRQDPAALCRSRGVAFV